MQGSLGHPILHNDDTVIVIIFSDQSIFCSIFTAFSVLLATRYYLWLGPNGKAKKCKWSKVEPMPWSGKGPLVKCDSLFPKKHIFTADAVHCTQWSSAYVQLLGFGNSFPKALCTPFECGTWWFIRTVL